MSEWVGMLKLLSVRCLESLLLASAISAV